MWRDLSKVLSELWHASGEPCSAYRPDLHYMRGPGPKWHAKYDRPVALEGIGMPALARVKVRQFPPR